MSLQARKLSLIEYLISLKDEKIFNSIEESVRKLQKTQFEAFTEEELILRAEESNSDYKKGKYTTQETLEKDSENW